MTDVWRYRLAATLALALAGYVTVFAAQTHTRFDLPTWLDLTEWPATLFYLAAAWLAFRIHPRRAAVAAVAALLAFYAAQYHLLFQVPLGFILATAATLVILLTMPAPDPT
ncbi:MAG: hypothetical protein AAFX45_10665 [Pseudomonadota bacterium]|mgnify:CR=1 FL=1